MKNIFIADIKDGQNIADSFLVKSMHRAETKAGKPYLNLNLMDKSGEIVGRVWEQADKWEPLCPQGALVQITAQCQSFRGTLQLNISQINRQNESQLNMADYVPASPYDINEMRLEFMKLARSVTDANIRKLLLKFFNDDEFMAIFSKAPAAKAMHHAYIGGLLEHTLGVARLADQVAPLYPGLDHSLLMAGAMLHDIGKVVEFDFSAFPADYSDQGRLMGHMVLGVEMVSQKIAQLKNFPADLTVRIKHLILSHHGRYEFGSPTLPMLSEGFVLNFIDDLDAKMNTIEGVRAKMQDPGYQWSDYQRPLERFLFIKGHEEPPPPTTPHETKATKAQQPSLFP